MFVLKVVVFFSMILLTTTSIVIDLSEEELQTVAAILVDNYVENNLQKHNLMSTKYFKKSLSTVGQFAGIMFSLVGANILTKMYERAMEPTVIPSTTTTVEEIKTSILDSCHHIFGCDDGKCWRTCNEKSETKPNYEICIVKPISTSNKNNQCVSADDCTPCGECISECKDVI